MNKVDFDNCAGQNIQQSDLFGSLKTNMLQAFFCIRPPRELLPVLEPLERYMTPTLDLALL